MRKRAASGRGWGFTAEDAEIAECGEREEYPLLYIFPPAWESGVDYSVVGIMRTDPDPVEVIAFSYGQGAVVGTDSRNPVVADLLEAEGGVGRVFLKALEVATGDLLDRFGQGGEVFPKLGYSAVHYSSRTVPATLA